MNNPLNVLTPTDERRAVNRRNLEQAPLNLHDAERRQNIHFTDSMLLWSSTAQTWTERRAGVVPPVIRRTATFRLRDWALYTASLFTAAVLIFSVKSFYLHQSTPTQMATAIAGTATDGLYQWQGFHRVSSAELFRETQ